MAAGPVCPETASPLVAVSDWVSQEEKMLPTLNGGQKAHNTAMIKITR